MALELFLAEVVSSSSSSSTPHVEAKRFNAHAADPIISGKQPGDGSFRLRHTIELRNETLVILQRRAQHTKLSLVM